MLYVRNYIILINGRRFYEWKKPFCLFLQLWLPLLLIYDKLDPYHSILNGMTELFWIQEENILVTKMLMSPVQTEFARTGLVPRMPTFVASCFFLLLAMFSFSCGLILDTQGKYTRQQFKPQMNVLKEMENHLGE